MRAMAPVRRLPGSAGALVLVKLAHSLYRRWERLGPAERERLQELAQRAKDAALDVRGRADRQAAEAELREVSERLGGALAAAAAADPDVTAAEVAALRAELAQELGRVAGDRRDPPARAA